MDFRYIKKMDIIKCNLEEFNKIKSKLNLLENCSFFDHAIDSNEYKYEFVDNPLSNIMIVYENNELIGLLDYWITFDSATIFRVCIKEEYQHQGIASKLISFMIEDLKNQAEPVSFISLEVRESNLKARKFYEKNRFINIATKKNYYKDNENAIYMGRGI